MKACYQCKQNKNLTLFYKNKSTKDGYSGVCKECQLNNERSNNLKAKEWLISLKPKCEKCGENRHWVLDFHHKDPSKKTMTISTYAISGTAGFETKKSKIEKELKTCCVLCSNCHRDFHYQEKNNLINIDQYLNI
jgi:protein-arginine kinase activator protein McsA